MPSEKLQLTKHCELAWLHNCEAEAHCPNCGYAGVAVQLAELEYDLLGAKGKYNLLCCPHCTARFTDTMTIMDYGGDELLQIGWPAYYAQMGAGIWPISDPLTRITKPSGARALEIGGAYGFGLDFCVNAKGWRGVGYDPSPLAEIGARELGLAIHQGYFTEETLRDGPWDVIIATEVVEHLEQPPAFLRLMRQAVAQDGILLLTTPNAEWITPALPNGEIYALLAPGAHVVLQTPQSMQQALEAAGFAHVVTRVEQAALVAYASPSPFRLEDDFASRRTLYRRYLQSRAAVAPAGSDLQIGFAGRALFDSVNDQDEAGAQTAWGVLNAACAARYGYRLDGLAALPPGAEADSLEGLGGKMPLGLGMILFSRAMQRLAAGENRQAVRPVLALARLAIAALQAALDSLSLGRDRLSVSIDSVLEVELLLCDAEAGQPDALERLLALENKTASWRGFVGLVNAGAYEIAARLREGLGNEPDESIPAGLRRDVAITGLYLELNPVGDIARAPARLDAVLRAGGDEAQLKSVILACFVALVNEQDFAQARAMLQRVDPILVALAPPYTKGECDALFTAGVLFLQEKKTWPRSAASFSRARDWLMKQATPPEPLFWHALRGEVMALHKLNRGGEARALLEGFVPANPDAPDDLLAMLEKT